MCKIPMYLILGKRIMRLDVKYFSQVMIGHRRVGEIYFNNNKKRNCNSTSITRKQVILK